MLLKFKINLQQTKDVIIFLILYFISLWANLHINMPHFDWLNYRFYDIYAFVNNRICVDIAPADFRTYFSNLLEIINYFFIMNLNNHPILFIALNSLNIPTLIFIVYKIASFLFKKSKIFVLYTVLLALLQPIIFFERGFSYNDITVAIPILGAFYFLIKNIFEQNSRMRKYAIVFSGFLIGISFVFKPTTIIYFFTILLTFLFMKKKIEKPIFVFICFLFGFIFGFILLDGIFRYNVYKQFLNPFFPYFENIFHSPFAYDTNIIKQDYSILLPKNLFQFVFYPFLESSENMEIGDQWGCFDIRIQFAYT